MRQLETPRLWLRDFTSEDAGDLHEILGDCQTMKYCEPAYDFAKTAAFLESFCIARRGAVAAVEKQSQKLIGYLRFHPCSPGVYEMGWFFNRDYWGRGNAYEACKALTGYAFREQHARKIFAETIDSQKSLGLMKKLGMQSEGIQRSQTLDLDGNYADLYLYGLLKEDWEEMV